MRLLGLSIEGLTSFSVAPLRLASLLGLLIAVWGTRAFDAAAIPAGKPAWMDFSLDYRVLAYMAVISLGAVLFFGLAPALRLSKLDVNAALKDGGRAATGVRGCPACRR